MSLPPGEYGYVLSGEGQERLDPSNPLTTYRGEDEVSLLLVSDCSRPRIKVGAVEAQGDGTVEISATFLASEEALPVDPATVTAKTTRGVALEVDVADAEGGAFTARAEGLPVGRHIVLLSARDEGGTEAEVARVVAWVAPRAPTWSDGVLYQVVTDRFRGDGGTVLEPPPTPGSRAGGTLNGVLAELERGTLDELGVTALWLSPVYVNPTEARAGADGRMYDSYHGYWPLESRAVDPRIGGAQALSDLVDAAHARGIQVLLDLVPNHVYEQNPRFLEHQDDGWFSPPGCVCGTEKCPWGGFIQTCWFTPYLPDIRWQNADAMRLTIEDALFWEREFEVDGFRIDAVPMMPRSTTRRVAHALRTEAYPPEATFLLGEIFTGPGAGGIDEIRHHLGPAGLNSAFDFPLMWAIRGAVARGDQSFETVEAILSEAEGAYAGSGAVLSLILGNHDTSRFISVAQGDDFGDPWDAPAQQPDLEEPYVRQALGMTLVFTLPGLPTLYYGDEVGLAGAGDPDCRRVMPADEALSEPQQTLRAKVRRLAKLRRCSETLRRGAREALLVDANSYVFSRQLEEGTPSVVLLSTQEIASAISLAPATLPLGRYVDALSGEAFEVDGTTTTEVPMPALSSRVLLPDDDPCLVTE